MLSPCLQNAYKVLDGEMLSKAEAFALAQEIQGPEILDLVSLANKVRLQWGPKWSACSILNAKSGRCNQNCRFCAQAEAHATGITPYPLMEIPDVLRAAQLVYDAGIRTFGYVVSGRGYAVPTSEFQKILDTFDALHARFPDLRLCASLGILSRQTAELLAQHHTWRYNMNLQTNPARYAERITSNHRIEEKIATIRYLQEFGVSICCGGILGLGETWEDRVEMAFAIRELRVEGSPLNVLLPIPGTPLEKQPVLPPLEVAKAFALFRLINPRQMIKFAAGRETVMKDFQGLLMLSGLDSYITGGYLTTRGRSVAEDETFRMLLDESDRTGILP
ncbi:MAG: biotin synthase BioB [Planctomycetia bacterium]|nr:biotin synthase BioB [Planctomycetia bacterium]